MPIFDKGMRRIHSLSDLNTHYLAHEQDEIFKDYTAGLKESTKDKSDTF